MRKVRASVGAKKAAAKRPVSVLPGTVAPKARREEPPTVARPRESESGRVHPRATQRAAAARIVDAAKAEGWGFRANLLGKSGSGKTHFTKALIAYAMEVGAVDIAFVYDHKDPRPSFAGLVRRDVAAFIDDPLGPGDQAPRVVVFHEDGPGDPDSVADLTMSIAGAGVPAMFVNDELFPDSVTEGGQRFRNGATSPQPMLLRTGRSRAASGTWGTQVPQEMPTTIMSLCETMVVFQLQAGGLDYLVRERRIPPEAGEVVRTLTRGECILISEGGWDGTIYGPG